MRQLKAGWTIEHQVPIVDDDFARMTKGIREEIDAEVTFKLLVKGGWHEVIIPRITDMNHAIDISDWLENYCQGRYRRIGCHFAFEYQKDANWFKIRWI